MTHACCECRHLGASVRALMISATSGEVTWVCRRCWVRFEYDSFFDRGDCYGVMVAVL